VGGLAIAHERRVGANRPDLINPIEDAADAPLQLALA
jgi:hypothetical protein